MQSSINIPGEYIINKSNESTIKKHMKRIVAAKKERMKSKRINYVNKLVNKEIEFTAFLEKQHAQRVDDCKELFLFNDSHMFNEVHHYLSSITGEGYKTGSVLEHEIEHYKKAQKYNIIAYYAIDLKTQNRIGKTWTFKTSPTLVVFVEAKALEGQWSMKKYIEVTEDILSVSNMSSGDLKTLEAIKALKGNYNIH